MSPTTPDRLRRLTEDLLAAATRAGAGAADVIAVDGTSISIDVARGGLEHAERSEGVEVGLRVLMGRRQACVASSDISVGAFAAMAERAVAMAKAAPEDPFVGLADPDQLAAAVAGADMAALELADPSAEPDPAALEDAARRLEAAALAVGGIAQVSDASAAYGRRAVHLAATNGFSAGYARTDRSLSCVAIAGEGTGMERDWSAESRIWQADLPAPEDVGRRAAERTVARIGARRPKTGAVPVLFDERVAASLIGHILQAANGASVARGSSWLRGRLGQRILPAGMDLLEEPRRPRASGSRSFDAEGIATSRRAIVEDGVLMGWTLDLASARKLGMASTGNAARGTSMPPAPAVTNVTLTPGTHDAAGLMAQMGTGLLVTSLIGSTVNPNTGDYSRGASGLWVENGVPVWPVNECTIAGSLPEMLATLVAANDARPHLSHRVPSLLVEGLVIAGE